MIPIHSKFKRAGTTFVLVFAILTFNFIFPWIHIHPDNDHHGYTSHIHYTHINLQSKNDDNTDKSGSNTKYNNVPVSHLLVNADGFINKSLIQKFKIEHHPKTLQCIIQDFHTDIFHTCDKTVYPLKFPIYISLTEFHKNKTNLSPPIC